MQLKKLPPLPNFLKKANFIENQLEKKVIQWKKIATAFELCRVNQNEGADLFGTGRDGPTARRDVGPYRTRVKKISAPEKRG